MKRLTPVTVEPSKLWRWRFNIPKGLLSVGIFMLVFLASCIAFHFLAAYQVIWAFVFAVIITIMME